MDADKHGFIGSYSKPKPHSKDEFDDWHNSLFIPVNPQLYSILLDALVLTQEPPWHMLRHMKAVTIHVEELVYRDFQKLARRTKRSTSELIREAMDNFRRSSGKPKTPLWQATEPASVGHIKIPWTGRENLADGFFDRE